MRRQTRGPSPVSFPDFYFLGARLRDLGKTARHPIPQIDDGTAQRFDQLNPRCAESQRQRTEKDREQDQGRTQVMKIGDQAPGNRGAEDAPAKGSAWQLTFSDTKVQIGKSTGGNQHQRYTDDADKDKRSVSRWRTLVVAEQQPAANRKHHWNQVRHIAKQRQADIRKPRPGTTDTIVHIAARPGVRPAWVIDVERHQGEHGDDRGKHTDDTADLTQ